MYGQGISTEGDILDMAAENDIVEKSGAWFSYDGERLGQGREKVKDFLKENKDILEAITGKLKVKLGLVKAEVEEEKK